MSASLAAMAAMEPWVLGEIVAPAPSKPDRAVALLRAVQEAIPSTSTGIARILGRMPEEVWGPLDDAKRRRLVLVRMGRWQVTGLGLALIAGAKP